MTLLLRISCILFFVKLGCLLLHITEATTSSLARCCPGGGGGRLRTNAGDHPCLAPHPSPQPILQGLFFSPFPFPFIPHPLLLFTGVVSLLNGLRTPFALPFQPFFTTILIAALYALSLIGFVLIVNPFLKLSATMLFSWCCMTFPYLESLPLSLTLSLPFEYTANYLRF